MSNVVSWIIKAQDQFSSVAKNIRNSIEGIEVATVRASEKLGILDKSLKGLKSASKLGKELTHLTAPLAAIGAGALHAASKYQQLEVAFTSMRGSVKGAKDELNTIMQFSRKGAFTFFDVASSEKLLRQSGVSSGNIMKVMSDLGDISAGAGLPLGRLSAIMSKVISRKYVQTREANQLLAYHIDFVGDMAKKWHVSRAEVMKALGKRGAMPSSALLMDFAENYTAKGKMFHDQMAKQMLTIGGSFNKMKEGFEVGGIFFGLWMDKILKVSQHMRDVGNTLQDKIAPFFEFLVTKKSDLDEFFYSLENNNPKMASFLMNIEDSYPFIKNYSAQLLKLVSGFLLLGPAMYTLSKVGRLIAIIFGPITKIILFAARAFRILALALLDFNPWTMAALAIAGVGYAIYKFATRTEIGRKAMKGLIADFKSLNDTLKTTAEKFEKSLSTNFPKMQFKNAYLMNFGATHDLMRSKSEVNINLKGNTDVVNNVTTKSKGATVKVNNLGKNMVPT